MRWDRCCGFDQMTKLIIFCLNGFRSAAVFSPWNPLKPLEGRRKPVTPHWIPPLERQQLIYVRVSLFFPLYRSLFPSWLGGMCNKIKTTTAIALLPIKYPSFCVESKGAINQASAHLFSPVWFSKRAKRKQSENQMLQKSEQLAN